MPSDIQEKSFIHLRVHSEYSIQDGMIRIDELMEAVARDKMPAVAITDSMNLFAVVKHYKTSIQYGLKPIIGCEVQVQYANDVTKLYSLVLLCMTPEGYRNLTELVSLAYEKGQIQGKPRIYFEWIQNHHEGLIALSGAALGDIGQAILSDNLVQARIFIQQWQQIFHNRFYLEIQRLGFDYESKLNHQVIQFADEYQLPLVATNSACFIEKNDFEAHEARVCIHQGRVLADPTRPKSHTEDQYLKSQREMCELFVDLPQALKNSIEIAKRCNVPLKLGKSYLPNFPTPNKMAVEVYLKQSAEEGLLKRLPYVSGKYSQDIYHERLAFELKVINDMGFPGYFLIVADFIQWAKDNQIPVGPGRGSGAGSLVAYSLGITDLDPLEYDLLFERFLNPERVSMPDFDVDFCMVGRDRVIDYVARHYGRDSVAQIITFGTMAAKAVVRDVGRVLSFPYSFVDKIAKLIPFEIGMTLANALSQEPELLRRYQEEDDVKELLDLAQKLEGITRNAGKHAGGVVIAPSMLTDFSAVYCEENSTQKVSQFDKDDVEAVGLVKFDFLGLRTLTIIDDAIRMLKEVKPDIKINIAHIPLDDAKTFELLQSGFTTAVFQLESRGMQELITRLKPDCFEDIVALVALFRPGPLQSGMVDDFIDRKQGRAPIVYLHPDLESILKPTYGVILYQEQVMQIAQVLANYTLGAADLLRRAMGKKKPEEMAKQRTIFLDGAEKRGIDLDIASQIFDLMEKFAGYGFNKSHSAAYALVSYQTAWLKTHYPAAFMAAVLSSDMDNTDKVVHMLRECKRMGLNVHRPSIQKSQYIFRVLSDTDIEYGIGAVKGIGESAVEYIVDERNQNGVFQSIYDVCKRVDLRKINKRVLEALIKSGALDEFPETRSAQWNHLEEAMKLGAQNWQNQQFGQSNLFSLFDDEQHIEVKIQPEWSLYQMLAGEKETLGWYVSGHPSDEIVHEFRDLCLPLSSIATTTQKVVRLCGQITEWRKMITKKGKPIIIMSLTQGDFSLDMILFPEKIPDSMQNFGSGDLVLIEGEVSLDPIKQRNRVVVQKIMGYADAREHYLMYLILKLSTQEQQKLETIQRMLSTYPGDTEVRMDVHDKKFNVHIKLGENWRIKPSQELINALRTLLSHEHVDFKYVHQIKS